MEWKKLTSIPELIRLENTLFVLPFVYIGMLYSNMYTLANFLLITAALVSARGAAFAFNRYAGLNYDIKNPAKKNWSSVKLYSKIELLVVFMFFVLVFLECAFQLNALAFMLAPLVVLLVIAEPYTKRYTEHRHFIMAFVIGLGILGGYIGAAGAFPTTLPIYLLLLGYIFFSAGSDIIYTLNHVDFDKKNGLKTYPVKFGVNNSLSYSMYSHTIAALFFLSFGLLSGYVQMIFGAVIASIILLFEHRNLNHKSKDSLRFSFFYYNAAVSLVMLLSVIVVKFVI